MKFRKTAVILCLAVLAASFSACSNSGSPSSKKDSASATSVNQSASKGDKTFKIDLATAYAGNGPAGKAMQRFVDDVKKKSGGSIEISLFTDGTLGTTTDNYTSVASGNLDMTMSGLEGLDLYAPEYTFLDCPFLIKSKDHLQKLLNSGIGEKLKKKYEDNGLVTLGWHNRDIRELASNKEVKAPADVKGLKLRLPGMTIYVDAWKTLGVTSTTVAMNELYTALQTKVAESCEGGYEQMDTLKLYEVQKYIAETDHVYEFVGLYIIIRSFITR